MALRPDEITNIIKEKIEHFDASADVNEVGTVIQVGDGIARVHGLNNVKASELVDFGNGGRTIWFTKAVPLNAPAKLSVFP